MRRKRANSYRAHGLSSRSAAALGEDRARCEDFGRAHPHVSQRGVLRPQRHRVWSVVLERVYGRRRHLRANGVVARQSCSQTNAAQGGHAHRVTVAFRERAEQLLALPDAVSRLLQLRLDLCEPLLLLRLPRAGTQA